PRSEEGTVDAPDSILVEFVDSSGAPIRLRDLGVEFLSANGIALERGPDPFRIAVNQKKSKAGNAYYEDTPNSVPLPDGLSTPVRVAGGLVPLGRIRPSKKGHPTREGTTEVLIGDSLYLVTVYLTEGRAPYYVKVIAHKKPDSSKSLAKARAKPIG